MYKQFSQLCGLLLRIPPDPEPPPGDESSTRCFRAAPNFLKYLLVIWGASTLVTLVMISWPTLGIWLIGRLSSGHMDSWTWMLPVGFVLLFVIVMAFRVFALGVLRLDYDKRWYLVTDRSLRVREGVMTIREMTITFANVQNLSISQGPIQRLLGIADLRVDTAGGGGHSRGHPALNLHTAWFRGINNAKEVRELIQERLRVWKDAGLGDHEDVAAAHAQTMALLQTAGHGVAPSPGVLEALRQVLAEATALRRSIGRS